MLATNTEKEEVSWQKIGFEIKPGPWEEGRSETAAVRMGRGRTSHPRGETTPSSPTPREPGPPTVLLLGEGSRCQGQAGGQG